MKFDKSWLIIPLLLGAFIVRLLPVDFPKFTFDEARVATRGNTLTETGKDELGRQFPFIFNSSQDYQLPVVSYITAIGELIFGKSEFGARIPFIFIGTLLVLLTYKIAKSFSQNYLFWYISAFVVAFSPGLIFLSKEPNETGVLTFIFALLFYLLIYKKNLLFVIPVMIISLLTSKQAWFILLPFTFFTVIFYQKFRSKREKIKLVGFAVIIVLLTFVLFLTIPQAKRSLLENNFSLFSNLTISNGIDKLRGQGIQSGWPPFIDRFLFNKAFYLIVGFLHWLSNIRPAVYFGQFDNSGQVNYSYLGAWAKILFIPFSLGLYFLIRKGDQQKKSLLLFFLILTFPSFFIYPNASLEIVALTLPFMALIISFGLEQLNKKFTIMILLLMITEVVINIYNFTPEYRNTTVSRPTWAARVAHDISEKSKLYQTAFSDYIVFDIVPFLEWYTSINPQLGFLQINFPYKYRQYKLADIKIVGLDESFTTCSKDGHMEIFISKQSLSKIQHKLDINVVKTYQDSNGEDKAYLIENVCI